MQKRQFGSAAHEVAVIGQGTWYIEEGKPAVTVAVVGSFLTIPRSESSFGCGNILSFTIPKRPVFLTYLHQADEVIFPMQS